MGELRDRRESKAEVSEVIKLRGVSLDIAGRERVLVRVRSEALLSGDDSSGVLLILSIQGTLLSVSFNALIVTRARDARDVNASEATRGELEHDLDGINVRDVANTREESASCSVDEVGVFTS